MMPPSDHEDLGSDRTTNKVTNINTILGIVIIVCTIAFNVGGASVILWQLYANATDTAQSFKEQSAQIATLKDTTLQQSFAVSTLQRDQGILSGQLASNQSDDVRQWESLRLIEANAKASLSREQFAEWRREYERRNPGAVAPSVPQ